MVREDDSVVDLMAFTRIAPFIWEMESTVLLVDVEICQLKCNQALLLNLTCVDLVTDFSHAFQLQTHPSFAIASGIASISHSI